MNVAYVIPFDIWQARGLWVRLEERMRIWAELDLKATILVCTPSRSAPGSMEVPKPHSLRQVSSVTSSMATFALARVVSGLQPDVVYLRYGLPYPGLIRMARKFPTAIEVHSNDLVEAAFRPHKYRIVIRALRRPLLNAVNGAVFVDPDLASAPSFARIHGPRVTIPNGIALDPGMVYGGGRNRTWSVPRLLMAVGALEPWQGLDKLLD